MLYLLYNSALQTLKRERPTMKNTNSFFNSAIHYLLLFATFGMYNNHKGLKNANENLKGHEHGFFQPPPTYHTEMPTSGSTTLLPGERKKKKAMCRMQKENRKINYHKQKVACIILLISCTTFIQAQTSTRDLPQWEIDLLNEWQFNLQMSYDTIYCIDTVPIVFQYWSRFNSKICVVEGYVVYDYAKGETLYFRMN